MFLIKSFIQAVFTGVAVFIAVVAASKIINKDNTSMISAIKETITDAFHDIKKTSSTKTK